MHTVVKRKIPSLEPQIIQPVAQRYTTELPGPPSIIIIIIIIIIKRRLAESQYS
jgi:hypothetical protein